MVIPVFNLLRKTMYRLTVRSPNLTAPIIFLIILMVYDSNNAISFSQSSSAPSQSENGEYEIDSLFLALLTNGDASVDYNLVVKSNKSSIDVILFGETIKDLTLSDYNETDIRYVSTQEPNVITVYPETSSDIHVTYTTSDLVDKQNRNWTFSLFFEDKFLLKMPSQAQIIKMNPPPFMTPTEDQNLWGFGPGDVQVNYVLGPLGTREESQASIRSLEEDIKNVNANSEGIVLNNITQLLDKAKLSFRENKYLDTVTYSTNALTLLQNVTQKYIVAKNAITKAESEILIKRNSGYDTSVADASLTAARNSFLKGEYKNAEDFAKQSVSQVSFGPNSFFGTVNNYLMFIVAIIISSFAVIFIIFRKRKISSGLARVESKSVGQGSINDHPGSVGTPLYQDRADHGSIDPLAKTKLQEPTPLNEGSRIKSSKDRIEINNDLEPVIKDVENGNKNDQVPLESHTTFASAANQTPDKEFLSQVIGRMKFEKPYLRIEDKDLLDYLCEKQGSAFESEIRNKFVLPRTSLWRLIKRLEREELVEVRKIGGQNLIKLRFEDKIS